MRAQVTLHTTPPGSLCSPPRPGSRDPGTTSQGERMARLELLQRHDVSPRLLRTAPSPRPERARAPEAAAPLTPSCLSEEQTPSGDLHTEAGPNPKLNPWELCKQRREREISPSSLRSSGLKLHNQPDVPASVEYLNRQPIIPN